MEDVTDPAFRLMCKQFGADMVYTEFVSSDALIRSVGKTMLKLNISEKERPVAIQIYGKDTDTMVEAARIVEQAKPDILDLNFGCPVKRVAGKGAGSGMLQNVPKMLEITRAVVDAVKIPVTVKTRLGWDAEHKIIVELAEQLQDCGIEALTIHGRTRAQMYTGEADWTLIGEVKKNPRMRIPIIGNGDITTPQRAKECFEQYGVDAIMIGRASFGRPWIFKEVKHYLETGEELPPLSFKWRMDVLRQFAHFILRFYDVPPRKVEAPMIERYLALLYDQGREKTSQARALSGIRSFYNYLMLTDVIDSTPTQFIDTPKFGRHLPDILTVEEIDRIVAAVDTSTVKGRRDSAMLEVLYSCGLRVSELTSLRLGDLFFGEGYIRVTGKGDKQRLVPVSGAAREKIQRYLDDRATKTSASDVVFLNNRGTQLTRVMVFTILREAVHRAGIDKHISPHTFRHSFATHLLEGGASIRQVQEMLGHESILTTEIYTHLEGDHLRDTVEKYLPL
jgi:nifR3 family TIM-barrel protein